MVALQALALYSMLVFSPKGSSTVSVQAPSSQLVFEVNQDNKLLYQEKMLQDLKGTINLEAKGSMCASIQVQDHKRSTQNLHTCSYLLHNSLLDFIPDFSSLQHPNSYQRQSFLHEGRTRVLNTEK